MSLFKRLTFLKALTAIAWADGEMTHSELNLLKSFYRKLNLDPGEFAELKHYLEAPLSREEQDKVFQDLIAELQSPREKQEIVEALETVANTHRRVGEEEKALVRQFTALLNQSSFTQRSLGKVRNLFKRTILKSARDRDPDLEKYFKRKVFKRIELKAAREGHEISLSEDKIYFICLFGTLLASVAHADYHFDESEKKALKKIMKERFSFRGREWDILFQVIEDQAKHGFDFHEVVTEINRLTSFNDRLHFLDCFFAIAAADGTISHEESEEIRRITKAMHIPHGRFKESKMKALKQPG